MAGARRGIRMIKGVPGGVMIDGRAKILTEVYEGWKYDTVAVENGGALTAGLSWNFFRDLNDKDLIDSNITQQRRISRGEEMEITSIGAHVSTRTPAGAEVGALIFKFVVERLYLLVRINKKDVTEGPLMFFQPGMGVSGDSTIAGTSILNNGVPSLASIRQLRKTIVINSDHDLEGILTCYGADWLTGYAYPTIAAAAAVLVKLLFGGKIKTGVTRG